MNHNNRVAFPVSQENQALIENICSTGAFTFESFLEHLLNLYKRSLNEPLHIENEPKKMAKK